MVGVDGASGLGLSVGSEGGLGLGASVGAVVLRKPGDLPEMARRAAGFVVRFRVDLGLGGGGMVTRGWTGTGVATEVEGETTAAGAAFALRLGLAFLANALAIGAGGVVLGVATGPGGASFGAGSGAAAAFSLRDFLTVSVDLDREADGTIGGFGFFAFIETWHCRSSGIGSKMGGIHWERYLLRMTIPVQHMSNCPTEV